MVETPHRNRRKPSFSKLLSLSRDLLSVAPLTKSNLNQQTPIIVRVCVNGWVYRKDKQENNVSNAKTLLNRALRNSWPTSNRRADIAVLPGGLVFDEFPDRLKILDRGWNSKLKDFDTLTACGEECIQRVLDDSLIEKLSEKTRYLTFGVDLKHINDDKTGRKVIAGRHFELVAVLKLTKHRATVVAWTGKSYPTDVEFVALSETVR